MIYKIPVVTITYDNGDGGYSVFVYNDYDELIKDHRYADRMTDELRKEILSGEDEYNNGYIDRDYIEIEIDINKETAKLRKPFSFSAGQ